MRFYPVIFIMFGLFGCDEPPGAGTEGHECHGWPSYGCDGDLRCVNDTCVACGGNNEACCDDKPCNDPSLACDTSSEGAGKCQNDCGLEGLPCCADGTCPGGGSCNESGTCETATVGDSCVTGDTPHGVAVIDSNCGLLPVDLATDTDAEAQECRQKLVDAAAPGVEVCPLDTKPMTAVVCQDGWGPLYLWYCSDQQLQLCEYNLCITGCTYTAPDANGHCPLGP